MPTYTFSIGGAFPESDPVARFVTVLAMVINDWHRTLRVEPQGNVSTPSSLDRFAPAPRAYRPCD
jgi:hypothetical protein